MPLDKVIPKFFPPTTLLKKDWTTRSCYVFHVDNNAQMNTDIMHELEVRDDDIWLVTLPKCGTTWMQELIWLVVNDCNFEEAKTRPLELRAPMAELGLDYLPKTAMAEELQLLENTESPRILKTHRPLPLMPQQVWLKKPKIIYLIRDPKDAMVSKYHFFYMLGIIDQEITLEQFIRNELEFEKKNCCWFNHALEFYALRNEPWVYYTSYENMKKDLRQEILNVGKFLNKPCYAKEMEQLLKHLSMEEMRNNPQVNHKYELKKIREGLKLNISSDAKFVRKGQVGSHKNELSPELIKDLDDWVEKSLEPYNMTLKDLLLQNL